MQCKGAKFVGRRELPAVSITGVFAFSLQKLHAIMFCHRNEAALMPPVLMLEALVGPTLEHEGDC